MDRNLIKIKYRIENLRNEMVFTFIQNGADMTDPRVLQLSQLLDEQLNRYDQHIRSHSNGKSIRKVRLPLFVYRHTQSSTRLCIAFK